MKKSLLMLIPLMGLLISCGTTPSEGGKGEGEGEVDPPVVDPTVDPDPEPDPEPKPDPEPTYEYRDYDADLHFGENGQEVETTDRDTAIQDALACVLDGFTTTRAYTIEDRFLFELEAPFIQEMEEVIDEGQTTVVRAVDEEEDDLLKIKVEADVELTFYEEKEILRDPVEKYTYGASINLKELNFSIAGAGLFAEPFEINGLKMRFVAEYIDEEVGTRVWVNLGNLSTFAPQLITLINTFSPTPIDPTYASYIPMIISNMSKGYINIDDAIVFVSELFNKEIIEEEPIEDEVIPSRTDEPVPPEEQEEEEQEPRMDYLAYGFNFFQGLLESFNRDNFYDMCGQAANIIEQAVNVIKYGKDETAIMYGLTEKDFEEALNALQSAYSMIISMIPQNIINMAGGFISQEMLDQITNLDIGEFGIPDNYKVVFNVGYLAGNKNGTETSALEKIALKANVQDGQGLYVAIENELSVRYGEQASIIELTDEEKEEAEKVDLIEAIQLIINIINSMNSQPQE